MWYEQNWKTCSRGVKTKARPRSWSPLQAPLTRQLSSLFKASRHTQLLPLERGAQGNRRRNKLLQALRSQAVRFLSHCKDLWRVADGGQGFCHLFKEAKMDEDRDRLTPYITEHVTTSSRGATSLLGLSGPKQLHQAQFIVSPSPRCLFTCSRHFSAAASNLLQQA